MDRAEKKMPVSFRFAESTVSELRRRARRAGRTRQTELAERYLIEGMRHDDHPLIHFRESAGGRRPTLLGSRLDVADVISTIRQNENSPEAAAAYLEIPPEQVQAAVAYYADYKAEVDAEIADREEIAAEAQARWERQQAALA
jgi:uncharacterized protein (DUF433 family)